MSSTSGFDTTISLSDRPNETNLRPNSRTNRGLVVKLIKKTNQADIHQLLGDIRAGNSTP